MVARMRASMAVVAAVLGGGCWKQVTPVRPEVLAPSETDVVDVDTPIKIRTNVAAICEQRSRSRVSDIDKGGFEKGFGGGTSVKSVDYDECHEQDYRLEVTCSAACRKTGKEGAERGWRTTTVAFVEPGDHRVDVTIRYDGQTQHTRVPIKVRRPTDIQLKLDGNEVEVRILAGDEVVTLAEPTLDVDGVSRILAREAPGVWQTFIPPSPVPSRVRARYRGLHVETVRPAAEKER